MTAQLIYFLITLQRPDGPTGPSYSSDQQKPSSNSGTTEAVTLQQLDLEQEQQGEQEAKMSLELTLSFAYM